MNVLPPFILFMLVSLKSDIYFPLDFYQKQKTNNNNKRLNTARHLCARDTTKKTTKIDGALLKAQMLVCPLISRP